LVITGSKAIHFITAKELARMKKESAGPATISLKRDREGVLRGAQTRSELGADKPAIGT
jgi:hypothetical protein